MCNINFWTFPKIHQFWWRHPSLMTENLIKPWQGGGTCGWNKGQGDPRWSLFVDKQFRKNTWFFQQKTSFSDSLMTHFLSFHQPLQKIFFSLHFYKKRKKKRISIFILIFLPRSNSPVPGQEGPVQRKRPFLHHLQEESRWIGDIGKYWQRSSLCEASYNDVVTHRVGLSFAVLLRIRLNS